MEKSSDGWHRSEENEVGIMGKVGECVPVRRLMLTRAGLENSKDVSRVAFEIEPMENMVCLAVTHDPFQAGAEMLAKVFWGRPT